jgi:hypothetical protein
MIFINLKAGNGLRFRKITNQIVANTLKIKNILRGLSMSDVECMVLGKHRHPTSKIRNILRGPSMSNV